MEENEEKIRIERILGSSVTSNAHFSSDGNGLVAYPAGNTVVLLDTGSGTVLTHVVLETRRSISALQLCGGPNTPLLFATSEDSSTLRVINFRTGVAKDISPCANVVCAAVSPVLGLVVTVGNDRVVSVWDFKGLFSTGGGGTSTPTTAAGATGRGRKLASSSVACKVSCVAFSPEGNYFVTGGTRHLKFWYLQLGKNECVLTGRPAILGSEHSNADFKDVKTDGNGTYAVANFDGTVSATLCQFDERRFLDKWVQLKTKQALCMAIEGDLLFIGCAEGIIRCFRSGRLDFVATLPLPHHLGVDIAKATDITSLSTHPPGSKFPNVVAICAPGGSRVIAAYADHSFYAWDVQDIKRVGLSHSWLYHSGCIWDLTLASGSGLMQWPMFITCSNDDTVRTWDIVSQTKTNLYSNECLDVKYISTRYLDSPLFISHGNGVRCVGIGASFVCCGDRQGNFRLWRSKGAQELIKVKAHKEEILSMDVKGCLVATASRDGSVNLYLIDKEIERIASLQEHKGSVTSVKILISDRTVPPSLLILSCGADKNLVFRQVLSKDQTGPTGTPTPPPVQDLIDGKYDGDIEVEVSSVVTSKTPLFDLETDSGGKHALVACQDACVRVYNIVTGKHSKTLRNSNANSDVNLGTVIKVTMDHSGYYVAVASTDKSIVVFDYYKGDVVACLLGHSELATALYFTPDFQNLISVGGDSCIFVWTLPREMVVTMEARMGEKRSRSKKCVTPVQQAPTPTTPNPPSPVRGNDYRFSFGQLPDWAKNKITKPETASPSPPVPPKKPGVALPQGKWSERVAEQTSGALTIKSFYHSDTVVPVPFSKPPPPPAVVTVTSNNNIQVQQKDSSLSLESEQDSSYGTGESFSNKDKLGSDGGLSIEVPVNNNNNGSFKPSPRGYLHSGDDGESTDFYSDVKSTDGETGGGESPRPRPPFPKPRSSDRDNSDSDGSSMGIRNGHGLSKAAPVPPPKPRFSSSFKDLSAETKDKEFSSISNKEPYEIIRSKNAELIMSVKLKNKEMSRSRQELELRLEETKKKLQSIGYKSMSQSTQDLSLRSSYGREYVDYDDSDDEGGDEDDNRGIRRACSLSDLNNLTSTPDRTNGGPGGAMNNTIHGPSSSNSGSRRKRSFHRHRNDRSRSGSTGIFDPQNLLTRSVSVSALIHQAQSDSEPESSLPPTPSYMQKTISSQGKLRNKPTTVVSAYSQSQENIRDGSEGRLRVSASEQNLLKVGTSKAPMPMPRSKMNTPHMKKPQQVYGIARGMAVVTGVRQGEEDGSSLNVVTASTSVEQLKKSLDQVLHLRQRVYQENIPEEAPITRILDEGLTHVQRTMESVHFQQEPPPKILSQHEPTLL